MTGARPATAGPLARFGGSAQTTASATDAATRIVAGIAAVLCGAWIPLFAGMTPALVVGVALLPVWVPVVWRSRPGRWFLTLAAFALASGVLLTFAQLADRLMSPLVLRNGLITMGTLVAGAGVLVWCRSVLRTPTVAILYGMGACLAAVTRTDGAENPWKYTFGVPVTIVVLALCLASRSRALQVVCTLTLAGISVLNDSRSAATMMVMVALLVAWQGMRTGLRVRSGPARMAAQLIVLGGVVFLGMQTIVLDGYLGEDAQQRTEMQIETSGSVFTGGRPEMGASVALVSEQPWGYGAGALPNSDDLTAAKTGMAQLNYDPDNGYVEGYLFGSGFEVHSVLGDQWIHFGIAGALFAVTCVVIVWRVTLGALARNAAPALLLYFALSITWDLLFSPFYAGSATTLMLVLALCLLTTPALPKEVREIPPGEG